MKYRAVSEHLGKSCTRSELASFFMAPIHYPELVMDVLIEKKRIGKLPFSPSRPAKKSYQGLAPEKNPDRKPATVKARESDIPPRPQLSFERTSYMSLPYFLRGLAVLSMFMFLSCAIAPNFVGTGFAAQDLALALSLEDNGVESPGKAMKVAWHAVRGTFSGSPLPDPLNRTFAARLLSGDWTGLALIDREGDVSAIARGGSFSDVSDWYERYNTLNDENQVLRESLQALRRAQESKKIYLELNLADNLMFVKMGSQVLYKFPVVTGRGYYPRERNRRRRFATPRGILTVKRKEKYPVWYPPSWHWTERGREVPEQRYGIRRVLGKYRLNLGNSYGIHGTASGRIRPGKYSHGCIRMNAKDLEIVYKLTDVGTEVYIY